MLKNVILTIFTALFFISCSSNELKEPNAKCSEKPKAGMCKAMFIKYYFNNDSNKCEEFIWGGCGGNVPFKSLKECKQTCEE